MCMARVGVGDYEAPDSLVSFLVLLATPDLFHLMSMSFP